MSCSSQGFGGGGITLLIETVVTDLVPLRERGKYMAITLLGSTMGTAGGPFIGGLIVERTTWRWIFYLNLPIASCKPTKQITSDLYYLVH
jgi:MFS family permease